jgi:hypothetical protein
MDGQMDEAMLERLEDEIERQEGAIVVLQQRTHTLELEAAAWPRPRGIRGPQQVAADRSRAFEEAFLGLVGGWLLVAIVWLIGAFQTGGDL